MIKEQDRKFKYNGRLYEVERLPTEGKKDIDDFRNKKIIKWIKQQLKLHFSSRIFLEGSRFCDRKKTIFHQC